MAVPDTALEAVRDFAASRTDIEAVLLHGSQAKGTARIDSDVDIALLLASGLALSDYERAQIATELACRTGLEFDVGVLSSKNLVFAREVFEHGVPLFIRNQTYFDTMRMTLLSMYLDFNEERKEILEAWRVR